MTLAEEARAVLRVSDNGVGIAPEDLPHVFERFYRADKSRAGAKGQLGLGLAICKAIIDAHNGQIEVTSEIGLGTCFTVRPSKTSKRSRDFANTHTAWLNPTCEGPAAQRTNRYPSPRTVRICLGDCGSSSSFWRSHAMCTSTVRSVMCDCPFHTCWRIRSRDKA